MAIRARIKEAMEAAGTWTGEKAPRSLVLTPPFSGEAGSVERWLELVVHPQIRLIAAGVAQFPESADLAARYEAERPDGDPGLLDALRALDAVIAG